MHTEINLRRLEEISQNASRPDRGLMIDGWSVGLSPGLAKRSRCVNTFYASARPFEVNLAETQVAFAEADLPCIFRISPFVFDATLDARLEALGYLSFDPALVMVLDLSQLQLAHLQATSATFQEQKDFKLAASWAAEMRSDTARETAGLASRWRLSVAHVSPVFAFDKSDRRVAQSVAIRQRRNSSECHHLVALLCCLYLRRAEYPQRRQIGDEGLEGYITTCFGMQYLT